MDTKHLLHIYMLVYGDVQRYSFNQHSFLRHLNHDIMMNENHLKV